MSEPVTAIRNLGPAMARSFESVGITDAETLRALGADAAYARLLDFTREVCAHAEQVNALVGIEPVALHTLHTPELTRRLIADVNSPNLRVILDTANLVTPRKHRAGGADGDFGTRAFLLWRAHLRSACQGRRV